MRHRMASFSHIVRFNVSVFKCCSTVSVSGKSFLIIPMMRIYGSHMGVDELVFRPP